MTGWRRLSVLGRRLLQIEATPVKIRFDHPASARMNFQPGDEVTVSKLTPEISVLLESPRLDGAKVARLVDDGDEELAVVTRQVETATIARGQRGQRPETVGSK